MIREARLRRDRQGGARRRIYDELAQVLETAAVMEKPSVQGIDFAVAPLAELDACVRKEIPRWAKVIKENAIKFGD